MKRFLKLFFICSFLSSVLFIIRCEKKSSSEKKSSICKEGYTVEIRNMTKNKIRYSVVPCIANEELYYDPYAKLAEYDILPGKTDVHFNCFGILMKFNRAICNGDVLMFGDCNYIPEALIRSGAFDIIDYDDGTFIEVKSKSASDF